MGCYDSSLLRPLLGSSSSNNQNNGTNGTQNDTGTSNNGSRGRFSLRQRRKGYNDMVEDDEEEDEYSVNYKRRGFINCEAIMTAGRKIGLLVWKNLLLRKRHYIVTTFEILLPTLFALLLVYGRAKATTGGSQDALESLANILNAGVPRPDIFPEFHEDDLKISCSSLMVSGGHCMVAFAPKNTATEDVISQLSASVSGSNIEWKGFNSEADVEKLITSLSFDGVTGGNTTLRAAIIFEDGLKSLGSSISYKIRMMDDSLNFHKDVMSSLFPWLQLPGPDVGNRYRYQHSGFAGFQLNLDKVLIKKLTNKEITHSLSLQPFPYPPYKRSVNFNEFYFIVLPNVITLGFIFIVPSIIRGIVNERETGIKELMKMCGIPNWMHWTAWMINSMLFLTVSVTIVIVLFFTTFLNPDAGAIVTRSDPTIWWLVLFLYVMASTSFCFFISSFFQRPTIAITVGIVLWLTTYYAPSVPLGDSNRYQTLGLTEKLSVALLPNMALFWGLKVLCAFEGRATGAQWNTLFEPLSSLDQLNVFYVLFMLIVDTILYICLACYVEAVWPSTYGTRKPWYFIFKPSMWGSKGKVRSDPQPSFTNNNDGRPGFEAEMEGRKAGVEIRNLRKLYGRNHVAVAGVSMKMYDGEIFALLGHNGAGKTSTINCCIGMLSITSGTAIINGYDIKTEMDSVRQNLGLCPQHNLLFSELTVEEHLQFFGRLKGFTSSEAQTEREGLLKKLQLTDKANTLARDLSGGQKRKLCLGIALIGRAKVVFLDEPTSGMDVEARRAIWDLLLEEREHRTIILTTHFLEEADVLGDRIAIMANGQVQCCGTSMFLKKFYGAGYTLSLTTEDDENATEILSIVRNNVANAAFKDENSNPCELSIIIPTESSSTSVFPSMFKDLSENKERLGIKTIGLSLTTMDEVFIKAGEVDHSNTQNGSRPYEMTNLVTETPNYNGNSKGISNDDNGKSWHADRLKGFQLVREQFWGLFVKRYTYTFRKWTLVLTQMAIPVFILIIAILAGNSQLQQPSSPPSLKIGLESYKRPVTLYSSTDQNLGNAFAKAVGPSATVYSGDDGLVQGLIKTGEADLAAYRERHIVAAEMNATHINSMFSTIPFHASPLALNLASNALLHNMDPSLANVKISVTNHPLNGRYDSYLQALEPDPAFSVTNALMFGALAPLGIALLAASYIVSPLEERLCNGKQLQLMTGVSPIIYICSSFAWDFVVMTCTIIVMVMCFPIFESANTYTSNGGVGAIFLILIVYGFSVIPLSYICSLFAGTVPGGFSLVTIIHIATGMMLPFIVYILEATTALENIASKIRFFARLSPAFGGSMSIMRFVEISMRNGRCNILPDNAEELLCDASVSLNPQYRQCCSNCKDFADVSCHEPTPYISWMYKRNAVGGVGSGPEEGVPGIGQELLYLFLLGLAYQVILIFLEYGFIQRLFGMLFKTKSSAFQTNSNDEDVEIETKRVESLVHEGKLNEDAFVVQNMCKSYGSFAAVSSVSFSVHNAECFGLLGVNGAGKTTTFRMLTGDEIRSNGNAFAMMYNLENHRKNFLANIGYCPQYDFVGVWSGREMIELFASLRGAKDIRKEAEKWLARVGLLESADVQCQKYSGGMKRRLMVACAMVGDPPVLLLDEPTSGVDPVSRREFWKIISSIRESGRAIILTSHSMEECEALCNRLGIMVNGTLQCLGSSEYLKKKFAQGYSLSIKLKPLNADQTEDLAALDREILAAFSPCTLKDKHQTALQYHVHNVAFPWDELFQKMEDLKSRFENLIEEYSIAETTLEEVFLAFARKQYSNREANISIFRKIITCQCCQ